MPTREKIVISIVFHFISSTATCGTSFAVMVMSLGNPGTRKVTPSWTLSGGGPLIMREKHMAKEKADMPWNVTRRMPASVAMHHVNPRKKSETIASSGDGREARYAAKGAEQCHGV
jgi:hypothetical protein